HIVRCYLILGPALASCRMLWAQNGRRLRHQDFQSVLGVQTMSRHRRASLTIRRIADGSVVHPSVRDAWSPIVSAKFRQSHCAQLWFAIRRPARPLVPDRPPCETCEESPRERLRHPRTREISVGIPQSGGPNVEPTEARDEVIQVVARTTGAHRKYFYRRFEF